MALSVCGHVLPAGQTSPVPIILDLSTTLKGRIVVVAHGRTMAWVTCNNEGHMVYYGRLGS